MTSDVRALAVLPSGDLVAGGSFTTAGGVSASRIARWNGTAWSPLGTGMNSTVWALAALPSGDLVAGGQFTNAGGNVSAYFARWTETNIPWIALQPQPQTLDSAQTLTLTATPANGYANVSIQWQRNGVPITNGLGGSSPGGGTVSGASGPLASPTLLSTVTLTITNAQASDAGTYTAVFSNACGSVASAAAVVTITGPARCNPVDIAFDDGLPLPPVGVPGGINNGVTEGDYNLFFATFFDAGAACDIANDDGSPLPPFGMLTTNNGVTEGDYNLFFSIFFDGCSF